MNIGMLKYIIWIFTKYTQAVMYRLFFYPVSDTISAYYFATARQLVYTIVIRKTYHAHIFGGTIGYKGYIISLL